MSQDVIQLQLVLCIFRFDADRAPDLGATGRVAAPLGELKVGESVAVAVTSDRP